MSSNAEVAAAHLQVIRDRLLALKLRVAQMEGHLATASHDNGRLSLRTFSKQFLDGSPR
jgi:hypothetical protein